jgi:hypothetical protein
MSARKRRELSVKITNSSCGRNSPGWNEIFESSTWLDSKEFKEYALAVALILESANEPLCTRETSTKLLGRHGKAAMDDGRPRGCPQPRQDRHVARNPLFHHRRRHGSARKSSTRTPSMTAFLKTKGDDPNEIQKNHS